MISLVAPLPPNIANGRQHWRVKLNAKQAYWGTLNLLQRAGAFPPAPWPAAPKTLAHARIFVGRQMDHDNAVARLKWLMDWLVGNGYLAGDSPKELEWDGFPEQVVKRDGNYRVELVLAPIGATSGASGNCAPPPRVAASAVRGETSTTAPSAETPPPEEAGGRRATRRHQARR